MLPIVEDYFRDIYHTSYPSNIDQVVQLVEPKVTRAMNNILLLRYTVEEVRTALFQMNPSKAPGPDGINAFFFQKFWHIVSPDIIKVVLYFLNSGHILKSINYTHLALISKTKSLDHMMQFRPISLCNVIYKNISKVLANRLKKVLHKVIANSQSAFVPGHLITDNILLAFEALHYMKTKRRGKATHMAVKLDMSKAYDCVE